MNRSATPLLSEAYGCVYSSETPSSILSTVRMSPLCSPAPSNRIRSSRRLSCRSDLAMYFRMYDYAWYFADRIYTSVFAVKNSMMPKAYFRPPSDETVTGQSKYMCTISKGRTVFLCSGNTFARFAFAIRHGSQRIFRISLWSKSGMHPGAILDNCIIRSVLGFPGFLCQSITESECPRF